MDELSAIIVAANTVTLVFGGAITALAYRASTRTGSSALRSLSLGLGLVTLGTLLGGGLHQIVGVALLNSLAVESAFTALGFVALTYSLYAERGHVVEPTRAGGENRRSGN